MNDPKRKYNMSMGSHSRVSNFSFNEEEDIYFSLIMQDLREFMDKYFPEWKTINLEVKDK